MAKIEGQSLQKMITQILTTSFSHSQNVLVLSDFQPEELALMSAQRNTAWEKAKKGGSTKQYVEKLATIQLDLPWSEHPAHSFFAIAIEQWRPFDLQMLLDRSLRTTDPHDITQNSHIAAVLQGMAYPVHLGKSHEMSHLTSGQMRDLLEGLMRTYLLDPTSQAADRKKLGFNRPLTTQDRFEILRCVWQCQQGLSSDLAVQLHTRLWITINHAERLLDYAPQERKMLVTGLFHILMHVNHFLTFWLNIQNADAQTTQEVKQALGSPLLAIHNLIDLTELRETS